MVELGFSMGTLVSGWSDYELIGRNAKNPPDLEGAEDQNCGEFRQFAAAPEPIISPDAEVIIAMPRPKTHAGAAKGCRTLGAETPDICPKSYVPGVIRQAPGPGPSSTPRRDHGKQAT